MEPLRITISEDEAGERLDAVVARTGGLSRSQAAELVRSGAVRVDGRLEGKSYRVHAGQVVEALPVAEEAPVEPTDQGLDVVYEDDHLLVVDKASGMVVHPAAGLREATLVDVLAASGRPLATRAGAERPGIVHRLDREVSGLLLVAKTDAAHGALVEALAERRIRREYLAAVAGDPEVDTGKIDAPVGRHPRHRTRMAVLPDGKPAVTWFRVRERLPGAALLEVRLETGRTHQIRTHLESIGHPILGDRAYGYDPRRWPALELDRPFLHAFSLAFAHPITAAPMHLGAELPPDLARVLEELRTR